MCTIPTPYPQEFRDDVVRVAQAREPSDDPRQIGSHGTERSRLSQTSVSGKNLGRGRELRLAWVSRSLVGPMSLHKRGRAESP